MWALFPVTTASAATALSFGVTQPIELVDKNVPLVDLTVFTLEADALFVRIYESNDLENWNMTYLYPSPITSPGHYLILGPGATARYLRIQYTAYKAANGPLAVFSFGIHLSQQ